MTDYYDERESLKSEIDDLLGQRLDLAGAVRKLEQENEELRQELESVRRFCQSLLQQEKGA
jgi:uncharacterized coiled-coil DUF342 family protein